MSFVFGSTVGNVPLDYTQGFASLSQREFCLGDLYPFQPSKHRNEGVSLCASLLLWLERGLVPFGRIVMRRVP